MTTRQAARRRRTLALLVASVLGLLLLTFTTVAMAQAGPCEPTDPDCEATTTTTTTTSTTAPTTTSTTVQQTTTTAARQTTTTERQSNTNTTERQEVVTTTTLPVTTSENVLVPGDGTEGAESTTTSTTVQTATKISSQDGHDRMMISFVIGGLLVLAVAVAVLTWRYWVATRPPLAAG